MSRSVSDLRDMVNVSRLRRDPGDQAPKGFTTSQNAATHGPYAVRVDNGKPTRVECVRQRRPTSAFGTRKLDQETVEVAQVARGYTGIGRPTSAFGPQTMRTSGRDGSCPGETRMAPVVVGEDPGGRNQSRSSPLGHESSVDDDDSGVDVLNVNHNNIHFIDHGDASDDHDDDANPTKGPAPSNSGKEGVSFGCCAVHRQHGTCSHWEVQARQRTSPADDGVDDDGVDDDGVDDDACKVTDAVVEDTIRSIDTVFISSWLCVTKKRLAVLRQWWATGTNALGFAEFWMDKCGDSERELLIRPIFTQILDSIYESMKTAKQGVGYADLERLVKTLVPEFDQWLLESSTATSAALSVGTGAADLAVAGPSSTWLPRQRQHNTDHPQPPRPQPPSSSTSKGRKPFRRRSVSRTEPPSRLEPTVWRGQHRQTRGGHLYFKQLCDFLSTDARRFRKHLSRLNMTFSDEGCAQFALAVRSWVVSEMAYGPVEKYIALEGGAGVEELGTDPVCSLNDGDFPETRPRDSHETLDSNERMILRQATRVGCKTVIEHLQHVRYLHTGPREASLRLYEAVQSTQTSSIDFLLGMECIDVNIRNGSNGNTPLHAACAVGDCETVVKLLRRGAAVNTANDDIEPLHVAVMHGHVQVVETLLDFGADMRSEMPGGLTAATLAVVSDSKHMAHVFTRQQAKKDQSAHGGEED